MKLTPQQTAVALRFALFFFVGELPAIVDVLSDPNPNYRLFLIGVLTALAGALEKAYAPQLVTMSGGASTLQEVAPQLRAPQAAPPPNVPAPQVPAGQPGYPDSPPPTQAPPQP